MSQPFPTITDLTGLEELRPGGHNFPDMQIVIDPAQTEIVDNQIYMIQIQDLDPVIKRCINNGSQSLYIHPALSTVHGQTTVEIFGRKLPCQTVEFSDNIYKRHITVHGRVVGVWAGGLGS